MTWDNSLRGAQFGSPKGSTHAGSAAVTSISVKIKDACLGHQFSALVQDNSVCKNLKDARPLQPCGAQRGFSTNLLGNVVSMMPSISARSLPFPPTLTSLCPACSMEDKVDSRKPSLYGPVLCNPLRRRNLTGALRFKAILIVFPILCWMYWGPFFSLKVRYICLVSLFISRKSCSGLICGRRSTGNLVMRILRSCADIWSAFRFFRLDDGRF
jgi:hypothetical protein